MSKQPAVYMLTNNRNGTLYIGVTSNLVQRIWQHKQEEVAGFSARYGLHLLVYFELHADMYTAISREKQLKKWNRAWKLRLIEEYNPDWRDLWLDIISGGNPCDPADRVSWPYPCSLPWMPAFAGMTIGWEFTSRKKLQSYRGKGGLPLRRIQLDMHDQVG